MKKKKKASKLIFFNLKTSVTYLHTRLCHPPSGGYRERIKSIEHCIVVVRLQSEPIMVEFL